MSHNALDYSTLDSLITDMNIVDDRYDFPDMDEEAAIALEFAELDDMDAIMEDMQEMADLEESRQRARDKYPMWS